MKKEFAEKEKEKYMNLQSKTLVHKKYNAKMKVIEIGIEKRHPNSNDFFIYCKLKGKLGNVMETIEYVLSNYEKP